MLFCGIYLKQCDFKLKKKIENQSVGKVIQERGDKSRGRDLNIRQNKQFRWDLWTRHKKQRNYRTETNCWGADHSGQACALTEPRGRSTNEAESTAARRNRRNISVGISAYFFFFVHNRPSLKYEYIKI